MTTKTVPHEGLTCTVLVGISERCGATAVHAFVTARGERFAECEEHVLIPGPATPPPKPPKERPIKCRTCGHVHTYGPCGVLLGPRPGEPCACTVF